MHAATDRPLTGATSHIKKTFGDLGRSLGYEVYASGYVGAVDKAWLYDMTWGVKHAVILAMESELYKHKNEKFLLAEGR